MDLVREMGGRVAPRDLVQRRRRYRVRPEEVGKFEQVRSTPWVKGSVRIGESAGSPAFWCVGDEGDDSVSVLVGHDDECWDLAVSLPPDTIDAIRREIAACPLAGDGA